MQPDLQIQAGLSIAEEKNVSVCYGLQDIQPVILAGGAGRRLWPLSLPQRPKPFIKFFGRHSMFEKTIQRVKGLRDPIIVAGESHFDLIRQQLQNTQCRVQRIFLEPCMRNTGPALAAVSQYLSYKTPDSMILVLPSDHAIHDMTALMLAVEEVLSLAAAGRMV